MGEALMQLAWRPYGFDLPQAMVTAQGSWRRRRGWLLRLQGSGGELGWGEAALGEAGQDRAGPGDDGDRGLVVAALEALPAVMGRQALEDRLPHLPAPLACAIGLALAELDGLGDAAGGGWWPAPPSAFLLPAGGAALDAMDRALAQAAAAGHPPTLKWKVAAAEDPQERRLLEALLARLPAQGRLRLDANGGWDRATAAAWADRLAAEPRLDWLEQPLAPHDHAGLEQLAARLPVALDESLRHAPAALVASWPGWLVRRPLAEGDPRPLLAALRTGTPRLMLSTALETGIGRRLLHHLAALQATGPTPVAPGLAPGWRPQGALFDPDPALVWAAAA